MQASSSTVAASTPAGATAVTDERTKSGSRERPDFAAGREKGCAANMVRADLRVKEVLDFLRSRASAVSLSHNELASALNVAGVLNLRSRARNVRTLWTVQALRPVRKRATEQLLLWSKPVVTTVGAPVLRSSSPRTKSAAAASPMRTGGGHAKLSSSARKELFCKALAAGSSERRALIEGEALLLDDICATEALDNSHLLDLLGLNRLDASLPNARLTVMGRRPSTIRPMVLQRLHQLFAGRC